MSGKITLKELRQQQGVTQEVLAKRMHGKQADVSKFESRDTWDVDSLARYINALGGSMAVVVSLGGEEHTLIIPALEKK